MEALKKAEEAKRLAGEGTAAASTDVPQASPAPSPRSGNTLHGSPLPDLSLHTESLDADLAAVSTSAPTQRRNAAFATRPPEPNTLDTLERRRTARNVFTAKHASGSRSGLWLFLGLSGIAVLGICAYFWWQLRAASGGSLTRSVTTAAPTEVIAPPAPPPASTQLPIPAKSVLAEMSNSPPDKPAAAETPSSRAKPAADKAPLAATERPARSTEAPAQTAADSPVRLSRNPAKPNPTLEQAYAALQAGRPDEAQRGYEIVLRNEAKNTDALLGLATLAARQGQIELAQAYYLRALESDPNDPTAQAGVINTRSQADPGQSESRLKTALSSQPDSPALNFALANLYAGQDRWSDAQQAYFRAYSTEPENADFIFNLAVSLDHLHQSKLAVQYYQMALNATGATNAAFDKNLVKARLLDLQP